MTAQQVIDAAFAEALDFDPLYGNRGQRIFHLDYTGDGERILRGHIQRALDAAKVEGWSE